MLNPLNRLRQRRADYHAVFTSEAGRRVLADLYRFCLMDQPCFAGDPQATAFNEGRRRVFLRLLAILRMTENDILQLSMEPHDE
jgi:hypothetical protein